MAKNKQKDTCLACNKAFTKSDASIQCVICALWIHHKPCSSISDDGFKFLSEQLQATGSAYWACRSCIAYSQGITQRVRDVEKKLEIVQKELSDNTKVIEKVDKSVDELKKELDKVKQTRNDDKKEFITAEEYREREARRYNIIMHRVPEPVGNNGEERKLADLATCGLIFTAIGLGEWTCDIKMCRRLGERGDNPRPLIIYLKNETTRTALLESAKHLRSTNYQEVSIVPDLTPAQRQEEIALSAEMERRNKDDLSEDDIQKNLVWRVVGPRGAKRLVKIAARDRPAPPPRGRGRGAHRGSARGGHPAARPAQYRHPAPTRTPTVPLPIGQGQPVIRPVTLLPPPDANQTTRKRSRDAAAAARARGTEHVEESESAEEMMEDDQEPDETRSPASKR
jgi:hypothetical protein